MKVSQKIFLEVKTDLSLLEKVLAEFNQFNQFFATKKDFLQCELVLAEGFTNAVRHAHKNLPQETIITIEITLINEQISMKIWDYGEPFDLEKFYASLNHNNEDLLSGGRGILIMKKIADKLSYTRDKDNRNCLLIVKNLFNYD